MDVDRRRAILLLGAAAAAAGTGRWWLLKGGQQKSAAEDLLAVGTPYAVEAAWLGATYLAQHPNEADLAWLLKSLWPAETAGRAGGSANTSMLARHLVRAVEGDFAAARTVLVADWVLSESEARLYALAALLVSGVSTVGMGGCRPWRDTPAAEWVEISDIVSAAR